MALQLEVQPAGTAAQRIRLLDYGHLIGLTLLYFDHLITLDIEIDLLWRRRKSFSAYWFFINRYFGFFSGIAVAALPFSTLSTKACMRYSVFREIVLLVTQTIAGIIMIIRVYALYGRNRRILWFMFGIGMCVVVVTVYSVTQQHASRPMVLGGCHFELTEKTAYHLAGSWEGLFLFDTVVFGLTVYNAYRTGRKMIPSLNLHALVVRDGAVYFGIMALANLANIASYYFSGPILPGSLATFASCISVTMISRLILNLHEYVDIGILTEISGRAVQNNIPPGNLGEIPLAVTEPVLTFSSQLYPASSTRPV
ncbi:hypothetical protein B0H14DRAFT_2733439 [Mycena olivaceomarginata]|nr:hypothetical protein B0H14DRAFT_2733439 [Mycena olivaceomarginata]